MDRRAPLWQLLGSDSPCWVVDGAGTAVVQILLKDNDACVGVFAAEKGSGLKDNIRKMFAQVPNSSKQVTLKVVADKSFSSELCGVIKQFGFSIKKLVERDAPFSIRYMPAEQKLLVNRLDYTPKAVPAMPSEPAKAAAPRKIKVLIVDDSATIRKLLTKILSSDPEIEVVGGIGFPSLVEEALDRLRPDVITLDIHLPEMNGVELLKKYFPKFPIPTVMISSISMEDGPLVLNAMEAGAIDYIKKPSAAEVEVVSAVIISKVKAAATANVKARKVTTTASRSTGECKLDNGRLIVIGSSTGGTEALKEVLIRLPENIPPILIVQHIPAIFSKALAERLNQLCPFEVVEATDQEAVLPNKVIIAPGGKQMRLKAKGSSFVVEIDDSAPVNRHKPSVDVLFDSVAELCGADTVGVILTGMGADGAKGLLALRNKGAVTIAQDEASCIVFGMPKAAIELGAAEHIAPLWDISQAVVDEVALPKKKKKKAS